MIKYTKEEKVLLNKSLNELEYFDVLNFISRKCYTGQGKEIILDSMPNDDLFWLRNEHQLIDEMISLLTEDDPLPFENNADIRKQLSKSLVQNAVLSTAELLSVAESIRAGRLIKSYFLDKMEKYPSLFEEADYIFTNRLLEKHINEAIDENAEVRDNATKELFRIRREVHQKSQNLRHRMNKIMRKVSDDEMIQEEFVTLREGRFVLPVKAEHKRHISGIIHSVSQTGATVFLEPSEIIELNNELSLLINEEKREIHRILSNLTAELGNEARQFLGTMDVVAHFDTILAKSNYALEFGGIKPEISDENGILLNKIRHPLLVHSKGIRNVIPLSLEFSSEKRGHLISGPNAGGKTVALKSIGLNVAMALSGIYPLGSCKTNFRMIYSSIGDHQSIEHDLSTFSSQIYQLKNILSAADAQSLVLIDEIGSGTDPQEGSALSAGILDTLIELKSFFIATTHNSSLKSYALSRDVIENASLEFNEEKLQPTYKFLDGIPGNSYAFQLAENLGLQKLVLERSKKYLGTKQSELEESISLLAKYKSQAEKLKTEANREKIKAEEMRRKFENKFSEIKQKRQAMINKAQEEAYDIINNANALIEKTIKEIKEEKKAAGEIKKDYNKEKKKIEKKIEVFSKSTKKIIREQHLEIGDDVTMEDSNSVGAILEIFDDNKTALVEFNGIKFKLPVNQLIKSRKKKSEKRQSAADFISFSTKASLDIRGKRAVEAISEVDDIISNANMSGVSPITIIHGKGTGALRHAIHEFLDNHHTITSYRTGTLIEGGDGVTIVEL